MIPMLYFSVPTYALLASLGLSAAAMLLYFRGERYGISFKQLLILMAFGAPGLLIGSRLMFLISRIPVLLQDFSLDRLLHDALFGGIVFYGGLIGALAGIALGCRALKIPLGRGFDYCSPAFPLFHAFGRIGCLLGGCCYGIESSWGVYTAVSPDTLHLPVQLFESAGNLGIFLLMILCEKKSLFTNYRAHLYIILYTVMRFILEFFRGDQMRGFFGALSTSQWVSILLLTTSLASIAICRRGAVKRGGVSAVQEQ